jgi:uncharacterized protein with ParB-like and HNH nuclease domain
MLIFLTHLNILFSLQYRMFSKVVASNVLFHSTSDSFTRGFSSRRNSIPLPDKLIVGYANWDQCDDTVSLVLSSFIWLCAVNNLQCS